MNDSCEIRSEILKAISQPTRLRIIEFLRDGERCVCEIFPAIGEEQSNTSRHLSLMQASGVLSRHKDGQKIYYAIKHPAILTIVDLATEIMTNEIMGRTKVLKVV